MNPLPRVQPVSEGNRMAECRCSDMEKCQKKMVQLEQALLKSGSARSKEVTIKTGLDHVDSSTANSLVIDTLFGICCMVQRADSGLNDDRLAFFQSIQRCLDGLERDYADMEKEDEEYHEEEDEDVWPTLP